MVNENSIEIKSTQCKGCAVCVSACPKKCIQMSETLNAAGYPAAEFVQNGCTACGFCFYACPEMGTITVFQKDIPAKD